MASASEQYINQMYEKQKENTLRGLRSAYEQNVNTLDAEAAKVPQQYYDQKREVEGNAEVQRRNVNEVFNANGLNTGAIGQANLALSNQRSNNIAALNRAQADAESEIELQRANLETEYKNAARDAIANSDYNRAQALYTAYQQQQAEAKSQVDALLKAGIMPDDNLIASSGYSASYVQSLYNAAVAAARKAYSGGGDGDKEEPTEEPIEEPTKRTSSGSIDIEGGAWKLVADKNNSNALTIEQVQQNASGLSAKKAQKYYKDLHKEGLITNAQYYVLQKQK